jgi:hypothetical protein
MRGKFSSGTSKQYKKNPGTLVRKQINKIKVNKGWSMLSLFGITTSLLRSDVIYNLKISSKVTNKEGN